MTRRPQLLAFATIQPILFVLMFRYVFGGSIHIPGVSYADYLMAAWCTNSVVRRGSVPEVVGWEAG